MRMQIYFRSGSYTCFDTTPLSIQDGMLASDDTIDCTDINERGLVVTRATYVESEDGTETVRAKVSEPIYAITPEEIANVDAIEVDGRTHFVRIDGRLVACAVPDILAPYVRDEGAPDADGGEEA